MTTENPTHDFARLSLGAVLLTSLATTVHHYYRFGLFTLLLGVVTLGVPTAALLWFRNSRRPAALVSYALVSTWIVVGFGLIDGMWKGTLRLFLGNFWLRSYAPYFSWAPIGSFPFEATAIIASVTSLFAAYYTFRFVRSAHEALGAAGSRVPPWIPRALVVLAAVAAVAVAAVAAAHAARAEPAANSVIKIGVLVPQQGPGALLGSSFLKAVELARSDLRGTKHRYELVIRDTGTNPIQTKRAVERLIGEDEVKAIVGGISLPGQVVKPYADYAKIPQVCVCSVQSIGDGVYNFTNIPLPEDEATRWVDEAKRRGILRVALLTQDYPSIDGHLAALRSELARRGVEVAYAERFAGGTRDFSETVASARAASPDVFFVEAAEPALGSLGHALKDAGIHAISSIVALSISAEPALFEGAWYTDSNLADIAFKTRFEALYPDTRFATHMMPYAYDSLLLVVRGFESGLGAVEYLRGVTAYDGKAGRVTRQSGTGNFRSRPAVWVIKNGKPELFSE